MSGLLPEEVRKDLPPLYATEAQENPLVRVKLFTVWTVWTWYVIEFDGEDLCFGLVQGHETELGYFSLKEMESIRGPAGLRIERDLLFKPAPLKDVQREIEESLAPRLPFKDRDR